MNKVIIITGGSRGIGAATALLAAEKGYDVCINYVNNEEAANKIIAEVKAKGRKAIAVKGDVSIEADVLQLFKKANDELGPVTALVNNAGVVDKPSPVKNATIERLQRMFAINVIGSFLCAREAVKQMSTKEGGSGGAIVNLSSRATNHGAPFDYVDYAAAKGAIDVMTMGLAKEVAAEGIRVNAVRPGIIDTEIHASAGVPDRVEKLKDMIPMKRGGTAEEVAQTILWLLSDESSYVTGSLVDVAGGR